MSTRISSSNAHWDRRSVSSAILLTWYFSRTTHPARTCYDASLQLLQKSGYTKRGTATKTLDEWKQRYFSRELPRYLSSGYAIARISPFCPFFISFIPPFPPLTHHLEFLGLVQIVHQRVMTDERTCWRQTILNYLDTLLKILAASLAEQKHRIIRLLVRRYHKL